MLIIHTLAQSPKKPTEASPSHGPCHLSRSAFKAAQHLCGGSEAFALYLSKMYVENLYALRDKRMLKDLLYFAGCVAVFCAAMRNEIIDVIGVFVLRIFVKRLCFENQTCRKIRYANVRI